MLLQDEESFWKWRYVLLSGQPGIISLTIKARGIDLSYVCTFGIIGYIKVYKVKGFHEKVSNGKVSYTYSCL